MYGKELTELNKCSNHEDTYRDGFLRVQDAGRHDGAMLSERQGEGSGKLDFFEVVAICDHLVNSLPQDHKRQMDQLAYQRSGSCKLFPLATVNLSR